MDPAGTKSPDLAWFRANHRLAEFTRERAGKFRHIRDDTVDAVLIRRMGIRDCAHALVLRTLRAASPLRHSDKETLIGSETVDRLQTLSRVRVLPSDVGEESAAQV